MRNLKIIGILSLVLVITISGGVLASDLLEGEFRLISSYFEYYDERHPGLTAELDLIFKKASWSDEFLFEINAEGDLKNDDFNCKLGEVYYKYYGENFDLAVGRQLLSWGTATEFNPTDNINPVIEMGFFADKEPIPMVQGKYYLDNNYTLEGVIIPYHIATIDGFERDDNTHIKADPVPDKMENSEYAVRLSAKGINGFDYSLSFMHGFEDYPTIGIKETPSGPLPDPANIYYREYNILGADFASSYEGIGFWGEAAYYMPDEGEDYYSTVLGADYKFENGLYLLGQAIYRKDQMLQKNTLLQGAVEKSLAQIHTMRTGLVYNLDTEGIMLQPELELSLSDTVTLNINYRYIDGELMTGGIPDNIPGNILMGSNLMENSFQAKLVYAF